MVCVRDDEQGGKYDRGTQQYGEWQWYDSFDAHGAAPFPQLIALDFTLKEGIEAMLMDEVEGIKEVRLAIDELTTPVNY